MVARNPEIEGERIQCVDHGRAVGETAERGTLHRVAAVDPQRGGVRAEQRCEREELLDVPVEVGRRVNFNLSRTGGQQK